MIKIVKDRTFLPREIIFSSTTACNLKCEHCFVSRKTLKLDIGEAVGFLERCAKAGYIEKVGFSGGEPFLYMEFLLELTKATISHDLLFDQIMTNGDWWGDEADLRNKLQTLYDAGYDGKIGLSWDSYHGQSEERMLTFIKTVQEIFGEEAINIQKVEDSVVVEPVETTLDSIPVYILPRTYPGDDSMAWKSRRWFKEDYCEGPGNIFYVHSDGNIAPCCGFANENPALFIGKITDTFETIMQNAADNKMVQLCFTKGLSRYRRFKKFPGKTSDICSFCDYLCKQNLSGQAQQ